MVLSRNESRSPDAERHPRPVEAASSRPPLSQLRLCGTGVVLISPASAMALILKLAGEAELALLAASLTATLALLIGALAVSQPVLCTLIRYLPEIMRARSEGQVARAAVCGPDKRSADAGRKRIAARAYASEQRRNEPAVPTDAYQPGRADSTH